MKMLTFAGRNAKEILRDPINVFFALGFPLVLLLLLSAIQANVPVSPFEISRLAPGIAVFGLSFMTLFSATVLSKDRTSALLQRLYTTPLTPADFIFGYALPLLPLAAAQCAVCYLAALCLGLEPTLRLLCAMLLELPTAVFFIALGLLCGSVFTDRQVGGLCGALLTNLTAWFSGAWFDPALVGGAFRDVAYALPFVHAVELQRAALNGAWAEVPPHLCWVAAYTVVALLAAVAFFLRQMKRQ